MFRCQSVTGSQCNGGREDRERDREKERQKEITVSHGCSDNLKKKPRKDEKDGTIVRLYAS